MWKFVNARIMHIKIIVKIRWKERALIKITTLNIVLL